ncbi:MAG: coenzyme F430 synthase [Methanobrevibacter sp.]|nr:coenzyme F430 synthase [Methanobrevibacter sp.]MBE6489681.1 coenzyme F430 synthase [Methanobrevibacter sp.]
MNNLVIDMTHGGVKIAVSLAKKGRNVLAYDIYNTLNVIDRKMLEVYDVWLLDDLSELAKYRGEMRIIYPVHLPLTHEEITRNNPDLKYSFITHHAIVRELLEDWGDDIKKIEITGVKGKTSSVFMLKEILIDENPLILSSLGALLYEDKKEIVLKRDISITPANIKETIDLAYKIANPICKIADGVVESENLRKYNSAIFESSLGASGIGDVGLLTNISENYTIAKDRLKASDAKRQIFDCPTVVCNKESLDEYYSDVVHPKINTFSISDEDANLYAESVSYSVDKTEIRVRYKDVKTVNDKILNGTMTVETFAPGRHHVWNVLGVILTGLALEIDENKIINGLANFNGITGRTTKRSNGNFTIIEEINPGINTDAIRQSIEMIDNLDGWYVAIGGDYGITCEEIDESKVAEYLESLDCEIILTGDVGSSIAGKMTKTITSIKDYTEVYDLALKNDKNLLFIYRSDYRKVSQR